MPAIPLKRDDAETIAKADDECAKLGCCAILLGNGNYALVDRDDFERLSAFLWHKQTHGYAVRFKCKKPVWMHRVVTGAPDGSQVDHINRNRLDNRKQNLRIADAVLNQGNRPKPNCKGGTSRFKGVSWCKRDGVFRAYGRVDKKSKALGSFSDDVSAALRYNEWAVEYFGKFALLNQL